jgi:hypothetical protein
MADEIRSPDDQLVSRIPAPDSALWKKLYTAISAPHSASLAATGRHNAQEAGRRMSRLFESY